MRTFAAFSAGLLCLATTPMAHAQGRVFDGAPVTPASPRAQDFDSHQLDDALAAWSVYVLDPRSIHAAVAEERGEVGITLALGVEHTWHLELWKNNLVSPEHVCRVATDEGIIELPPLEPFTYSGWLGDKPESRVRFSILPDAFVGSLHYGGGEYMIEPVHAFSPGAPEDLYVVYDIRDILSAPGTSCGNTEVAEPTGSQGTGQPKDIQACAGARIALAADFSFVNYAGSIDAARTRMITLLNIVDGRYRDNRIEIAYELVATFISSSTANDPWSTSTDASTLLSSFRSWGNGGGFGSGIQYAVASFWTRRNIAANGSTGVIGLAYVGVICATSRYNINEQSSGTSTATGLPSVCQTHEIGHNWNASHTSTSNSTFIMSPSIGSGNTQWDDVAIGSITAHKSSRSCLLGTCPPVGTIGINELPGGGGLTVYPNPTEGRFFMEWTEERGGAAVRLQVLNALGRMVREEGVAGRTNLALELDGGPGMYLVRVLDRNDNVLGTHRLVRY